MLTLLNPLGIKGFLFKPKSQRVKKNFPPHPGFSLWKYASLRFSHRKKMGRAFRHVSCLTNSHQPFSIEKRPIEFPIMNGGEGHGKKIRSHYIASEK
jgi:hypothetical protein